MNRTTSLGWVLGAMLGAAAVVTIWAGAQPDGTAVRVVERPAAVHVPPVISEDDPRWDCASQGNGKCGPGPVNAR